MDKVGWVKLLNARKFHYFNGDSRSLCGRWMYLGAGPFDADPEESPEDCLACRRTLELLQARLKSAK